MNILYVDESGVEQLNAGTSHFVLLGVMVPMTEWKELDHEIHNIKANHDLDEVEVHTGWMCRAYAEQDSVPGFSSLSRNERIKAFEREVSRRAGVIAVQGRKDRVRAYARNIRNIRPYAHLTLDQRKACLHDLATKLAGSPNVRIFGEAIKKDRFVPSLKHDSPYEQAFEQVLARYQGFLQRSKSMGIVAHDHNVTVAPRLTALCRKFHRVGTFYRSIQNVVETPLFVDSSLTAMIQVADLCSYALRRFIENNETALWDIVEARVDSRGAVADGLRHFTGTEACQCRICTNHGRQDSTKRKRRAQSKKAPRTRRKRTSRRQSKPTS